MRLKDKILIKILGPRACAQSFIQHLRKCGVRVGKNVVIFRPFNTNIDTQNPHLLTIGNDVMITGPVTILTHDYSWSVLKKKYGDIVGNQRKTYIGNNIFIGWGATILAGSYIGDNTIIGANSVVCGKLQGDAVYAGNPAKFIMSLDEYYNKRKEKQLDEAFQYVSEYENRFGKIPDINKLDEYFYLFVNNDPKILKIFDRKLNLMNNYNDSLEFINNKKSKFESFEKFMDYYERYKKNEAKEN